MSTNGKANGHCNGVQDMLQWKVGLINNCDKYLTAEKIGVNAEGKGLKKKQVWILEQGPNFKGDIPTVYLKSHDKGSYLASDSYGNITCSCSQDAEDTEPVNVKPYQFVVEYDASGKWAFKNMQSMFYLTGKDDKVKCVSKTITEEALWVVQLAIQPQVNLRSAIRKRYAVLNKEDCQLQCKETIPWGEEGLIILHFWVKQGKYSLKVSDGTDRFLNSDGSLVEMEGGNLTDDAKFTLEIKAEGLAFKASNGCYLAALGSTATIKVGKNKTVGKDEVFAIESSNPQVTILSQNNEKFVSLVQGVDLSANQHERCDKSTFQMEYDKASEKWAFRTCIENKYLSLGSFGGIQANSMSSKDAKSLFKVEPNDDGSVCIMADNKKYLANKQTGSISATADNPESKNFIIRMVNRPFLILKCDHGFVALKSDSDKSEVMCNKTCYEPTFIEALDDGYYYLKGKNNKYWTVHDDKSIHADSETGTVKFNLQFHGQSQLTIRPVSTGKYLKGEPNSFLAKGETVEPSTIWEY